MFDRTKVCDEFLDGEGVCFWTGKFCDYPYSQKYCEHQYKCEKSHTEGLNTISELRNSLGISKYDVVSERFLPDGEIVESVFPTLPVEFARRQVVESLRNKGYKVSLYNLHICRNATDSDQTGVYIAAKGT